MSFTLAVAMQPDGDQTGHFGRSEGFRIYEIADRARWIGQRPALPFCGSQGRGGASIEPLLTVIDDCAAVVVAAIGPCGRAALAERGISVYEFAGSADAAAALVAQWQAGQAGTQGGRRDRSA
jgi:predicted Fe-Mo cluster-binding NifX family protein